MFYDTLLDENAASHIALGHGFAFSVGRGGPRPASTTAAIHIDFMIGSTELEVTGVTATGERVPVLRNGDWQFVEVRFGPPVGDARRSQIDLREHGIELPGRSTATRRPRRSTSTRSSAARRASREGGPFVVDTGKHTGPLAEGQVRRPRAASPRIGSGGARSTTSSRPSTTTACAAKVADYLGGRDLYVVDAFAGADPAHRIAVRVVTLDAVPRALLGDDVHHADGATSSRTSGRTRSCCTRPRSRPTRRGRHAQRHLLRASTRRKREVLIGGTFYAGEIKKSIFTLLNDSLPLEGVSPMHCSANVGDDGDVAIFFGLSGTGKTTLSADPERQLIGDDEHGWGDNGVFNFEGGCYAKMISLSAEAEPEIYETTNARSARCSRTSSIDEDGRLDLDDDSKTENTRAAYKLEKISNALPTKMAGHPTNVVFLAADAFARAAADRAADDEQARYYFLSGFTSKLAGHRDRRHRAGADVLGLLRRAVPAAAARRSTPGCSARSSPSTGRTSGSSTPAGPEARRRRSATVTGCRSRRPGRCSTQPLSGRLDEVRVPRRRDLRLRGAGLGARCRPVAARPPVDLGRSRPPTTRRPVSSRRCSGKNFEKFPDAGDDVVAAGPKA